jgi:hypothetical protein
MQAHGDARLPMLPGRPAEMGGNPLSPIPPSLQHGTTTRCYNGGCCARGSAACSTRGDAFFGHVNTGVQGDV